MDVNELHGRNNFRTLFCTYGLEESWYASAIITGVIGPDGRWASSRCICKVTDQYGHHILCSCEFTGETHGFFLTSL